MEEFERGDPNMTFEAFFLKKKIDLDLLKAGKPELFSEFVSHFEQMNEKSFDHTKKYWFNNLRIAYPLSEEKELLIKEAIKAAALLPTEIVEADSAAERTIQKTSGFIPRFKAKLASSAPFEEKTVAETVPVENPVAPKPAGFVPRFKAEVTKPKVDPNPETDEQESTKEKPVAAKPAGFKPRFKAGVTKPAVETNPETEEQKNTEEQPIATKPAGFKPRVKTVVTKPAAEPNPETDEQEATEEKPVATKPAGFKPRFKTGVTKPAVEPNPETNEQKNTEEKPVATKPAGFKPRFKAPKKED